MYIHALHGDAHGSVWGFSVRFSTKFSAMMACGPLVKCLTREKSLPVGFTDCRIAAGTVPCLLPTCAPLSRFWTWAVSWNSEIPSEISLSARNNTNARSETAPLVQCQNAFLSKIVGPRWAPIHATPKRVQDPATARSFTEGSLRESVFSHGSEEFSALRPRLRDSREAKGVLRRSLHTK